MNETLERAVLEKKRKTEVYGVQGESYLTVMFDMHYRRVLSTTLIHFTRVAYLINYMCMFAEELPRLVEMFSGRVQSFKINLTLKWYVKHHYIDLEVIFFLM